MKNKTQRLVSAIMALVFGGLCAFTQVHAQDDGPFGYRAPRCTAGTASGTYGYHMNGQIVGGGAFLVNGIFTQNSDGTLSGEAHATIGNQQLSTTSTGGTWKINDDCTGSGSFFVQVLNQQVTYNFIATDGGNQIDLLNTDAGILLHGYGRRIAAPGKAPSCNNGTILGSYGYRLGGSIPNVPAFIIAGTFTHAVDDNYKGVWSGTDTFNAMGQYVPRVNKGIYTLNSNCRGTGFYTDNLGNQINYVFTVVDGGDTLFIQGNEPGIAASGIAQRIK